MMVDGDLQSADGLIESSDDDGRAMRFPEQHTAEGHAASPGMPGDADAPFGREAA